MSSRKLLIRLWRRRKLRSDADIFEINTGAISRGYRTTPYLSTELLRHLRSINGRITVSSDAHSAADICCKFDMAERLAKYGISPAADLRRKSYENRPRCKRRHTGRREYEKIIITVKQAYIGQPYKIFGLSLQLLSVI